MTTIERVEQRAADLAAELFFGESFDDYAAATTDLRADGAIVVHVATGDSTWDALRNACSGDVARAGNLSEMRTEENWRSTPVIGGYVMVRAIENVEGDTVAYLLKR